MAAAVRISATAELEAIEPSIDAILQRLQDRLNALSPAEVVAVTEATARALARPEEPASEIVTALTGERCFSPEERVMAELDVLTRSFARRRALLAGALTASQVAKILNSSRQTPHDRVAAGTLLAVMDQGAWRFPAWQFDAEGENGVVTGLPQVIKALDVSPMAKVSWLTRANPMLDGETPLARVKAGQVERVVALAHGVGIA